MTGIDLPTGLPAVMRNEETAMGAAMADAVDEGGERAMARILDEVLDSKPAGIETAVDMVLERLELTPAAVAVWRESRWKTRIAWLLHARLGHRGGGDMKAGNVRFTAAAPAQGKGDELGVGNAAGHAPSTAGGRGEMTSGNADFTAPPAAPRPDPYKSGVAVLGNLWWDTLRINGQRLADLSVGEARAWAVKHGARADFILRLTEGLDTDATIGAQVDRTRAAGLQVMMESEGRHA